MQYASKKGRRQANLSGIYYIQCKDGKKGVRQDRDGWMQVAMVMTFKQSIGICPILSQHTM